jgi:hypothetical protein
LINLLVSEERRCIILTCDFGEIGKIVRESRCGIVLDSYFVNDLKKAFADLMTKDTTKLCLNSLYAGRHLYTLKKATLT